jgi:hypothetical protein
MYECHITVEKPDSELGLKNLENMAKLYQWKTSFIAADPLLGKDNYFYFTCHHTDYENISTKMEMFSSIIGKSEIKILRKKIELIVYDTKKQLLEEVK